MRIALILFSIAMFIYCARIVIITPPDGAIVPKPVRSGLDAMTGRRFNSICRELLSHHGYSEVTTASPVGPTGAYITAFQDGERWMFRCWLPGDVINAEFVQDSVRTSDHYKCSRCGIISTGKFNRKAKWVAECGCVKLIGREELLDMLDEAGIAV